MTETSDTAREPTVDTSDVVMLIHGTFAADKERKDTGHRWWQRDSATWRELESRLPEGVRLPGREVRLFHWSGANTQSERLHASNVLLASLIKLEQQGRGYHLVGHSHGGSVIWEALTTAAVIRDQGKVDRGLWDLLIRRKVVPYLPRGRRSNRVFAREIAKVDGEVRGHLELGGLRSWTTVGTPFLRFLPSRRRFVDGWPHPAYSLADEKKRTSRRAIEASFATVGTLLLFAAAFSVILLLSTTGSPSSSGPGPYRGGLLWPCLGLVGGLIGWRVFSAVYHDLAESLETRERASRAAFARYAGRWLDIWAPTDEAITLLRAAAPGSEADYRMLFTPRTARVGEPFATNHTLIPWKLPLRLRLPPTQVGLVPSATSHRPGGTFIAPMYFLFNRLVAPRLANQLSRTMVRAIQGSDIAGAELVFSSPWPIPLDAPPPGLPDDVAKRLEARARSTSAELVPVSREIMAQAALGMPAVGGSLATARAGVESSGGSALVHTGYFEDPFVLELIVEHIRRSCGSDLGNRAGRQAAETKACSWLDARTAQIAERLETLGIVAETPK